MANDSRSGDCQTPVPPPLDPGFVWPRKTTRGRAIQSQTQEEGQKSRFASQCEDTDSEADRNVDESIEEMERSKCTTNHVAKPTPKEKAARKKEKVKFGGETCKCGHADHHNDDESWWVRPE